eukprot:TRINITY_DN511_c2_g1_i14.p1 TRINITY_DN511_c2_g1~~TRINITY_DN511_c2_g1_i14.p1  ORF type:complete len:265 (-),score=45.02 TRINITY_DN511_c2_g1_i14:754-1548(-)
MKFLNDLALSLPTTYLDVSPSAITPEYVAGLFRTAAEESSEVRFTEAHYKEVVVLWKRVHAICSAADQKNVKLLVDAEQTYFQDAIDAFCLLMLKKYNVKTPTVHHTYQMYLKSASSRLRRDVELAATHDVWLACKLVRGAYMEEERGLAAQLGRSSPILESYDETSKSYDEGVAFVMDKMQQGAKVSLMVASHNIASCGKALELSRAVSFPRHHLYFGQLTGMSDHLSLALQRKGGTVCKVTPVGLIEEVHLRLLLNGSRPAA